MPELAPAPAMGESYRKLPGRAWVPLSRSRVWLGRDHLLAVTTTFGIERYRRFYFKDIEALVVQRTPRRLVWNVVFGAIAGLILGLVALIAWLSSNLVIRPDGYRAPAALTASLAAILFGGLLLILFNTLRGRTCALFVQTSNGLARLPAPLRLRLARRVIARVAPEIVSAQETATNAAFASSKAMPQAR